MYSSQLLDHFEHPRNVGDLPRPAVVAQAENPGCGDILSLALQIEEGKIVTARFRARGCVAAIACGSALTELLQGKSPDDARNLKSEDLLRALGQLNPEQMHATHLALDALRAALGKLE